jgi:hypothetical protein
MAQFHVVYHFGSHSVPGAETAAAGASVHTRIDATSREQVMEAVGAQLALPAFIVESTQLTGVLIQSAHVRFVEVRDFRSATAASAAATGATPQIAAIAQPVRGRL